MVSRARKALWEPGVLLVLIIGVFLTLTAAGCSRSSGDGQRAVTQQGTMVGETITGERTAAQRTSGDEQEKTTHDRQEIIRKQERRGGQKAAQAGGSSSDERDGEQSITVRVTGTEGLSFAGRIGGTRDLKRVEGSVPGEYSLPVRAGSEAATVSIRKQQRGAGTLGVEIVRGDRVLASKKSSNSLGLVNVVWSSRKPDVETR